jgi:hypothetical protein
MRTDVTIDKKQVKCPNSSFLGYSTYKAQFGDLLEWQSPSSERQIGRMIGRIAYAPKLETSDNDVTGWIVVCALSNSLDHVYERWINPEWVNRITPKSRLPEHREVLESFLSDDILKFDSNLLRRWISSGYRTLTKFLQASAPIT